MTTVEGFLSFLVLVRFLVKTDPKHCKRNDFIITNHFYTSEASVLVRSIHHVA